MKDKKPFIGEASNDVRALVESMSKTPINETVGYHELTQLIGRDVTVHRHLIESARRILMRDHNIVFRCVMNEGYKRLDDATVVSTVNNDRKKKIRQQARFAVRELSSVNYENLDRQKQVQHNTGMAMFGVVIHSTDANSVKKLGNHIANSGGKLDVKGTLQLIGWLGEEKP
jgi:hypothetical protein